MTAPQRQHRWLAADHLEQKSSTTLRSLGDTTERRVWKWGMRGKKIMKGVRGVDGVENGMKKQTKNKN